MDIKTVRVTEIGLDKENQIRIPTEPDRAVVKGLKARLVFESKTGDKSTDIELMSWRPIGKGKHKIIIQVASQEPKPS